VVVKVCGLSKNKHTIPVGTPQPKSCTGCADIAKCAAAKRAPYWMPVSACTRKKKHKQLSNVKEGSHCSQCVEDDEKHAKRISAAEKKAARTPAAAKALGVKVSEKKKRVKRAEPAALPKKDVADDATSSSSSSSSSHSSLGPNKTKKKEKVADDAVTVLTTACDRYGLPSDNDKRARPHAVNVCRNYANLGTDMNNVGTITMNIMEGKVLPCDSKKDTLINLRLQMIAARDDLNDLLESPAFDGLDGKKTAKRKQPAVPAKAAPKKKAKAKEPEPELVTKTKLVPMGKDPATYVEPVKRKAKSGEHCDKDGNFVESGTDAESEESGEESDEPEAEEAGEESDGNDTRGAPKKAKTKSSKN